MFLTEVNKSVFFTSVKNTDSVPKKNKLPFSYDRHNDFKLRSISSTKLFTTASFKLIIFYYFLLFCRI